MFVIFKMDFKDKSNEIYVYHLKVTGIYDILVFQSINKLSNGFYLEIVDRL